MTTSLSIFDKTSIILPHRANFEGSSDEADICIKFLRYLSHVPISRPETKILSAIQYVADTMNYNDAHISKVLVDHGLRAARRAFPADFLQFIDVNFTRDALAVNSSYGSLLDLTHYWHDNGEGLSHITDHDYAKIQPHHISI